jgi:hypothetical protein
LKFIGLEIDDQFSVIEQERKSNAVQAQHIDAVLPRSLPRMDS